MAVSDLHKINELEEALSRATGRIRDLEAQNAALRGEVQRANAYLGGRDARKAAYAKTATASRFWMRRAGDLEKRMRAAGLPVDTVVNGSDGTEGVNVDAW